LIVINDQAIMKVARCCLVSSLSTTHFAIVIVVVTFLTYLCCFSFLLVFLFKFATSLSITFCYIMVKYSSKGTTWLCEQSTNNFLPLVLLIGRCGNDNKLFHANVSWVFGILHSILTSVENYSKVSTKFSIKEINSRLMIIDSLGMFT
jgi:hypothetical protein